MTLLIHGQPGNSIWQNLLAIWTSAARGYLPADPDDVSA